jgi:diguanylate cyclase (GGDEF)-like protein
MGASVTSLLSWFPRGRSLPDEAWEQRHRLLTWLLLLHVPGVLGFAVLQGAGAVHALSEAGVPALAALAAYRLRSRSARSCAASLGLIATSAVLVHLSEGAIEAHFHFFVMVPVVAMYEDWPPFGLAIGTVVLHHGVVGTLAPDAVYSHPAALADPWAWAAVHAAFITAACAASIVNWRLHENARAVEERLAAQMSHQARHDALTGLCNRRELERRVGEALGSAAAGATHVLAVVDLDRFKMVNDACGHLAGDELLRTVARLMTAGVRTHDVVARLGGDEFAVLLLDCGPRDGLVVVDKLRRAVEEMDFRWDGRSWPLTLTAGLAAADASFCDLEELLRAADAACGAAKHDGRNRVRSYRADDDRHSQRRTDLQMVTVLREALAGDGLELYLQPIRAVDPASHPARHGELLLRLHAEGTVLAPGAFLPAAERYDLMPAIDRWVVRQALRQIAPLYAGCASSPDLYAINLSGASLSDPDFCDFVVDEIVASGILPSLLCFEITETVAISNLVPAREAIQRLRAVGCRFALDDFGMGMSSFSYLKNLAVDFLKVDGSFVRGIASNAADQAVVEAVNTIAHALGMSTIAEYVENGEILERLRALGVDYAQGYEIARPAPLAAHLAGLAVVPPPRRATAPGLVSR